MDVVIEKAASPSGIVIDNARYEFTASGPCVTMEKSSKHSFSTERGFSLVELIVVVAMVLTLSAIAVPSVMQSIGIYRLNVAATSLQNLVEVTRFSAIRRNTQISFRQTTLNGQNLFYVDLNGTGIYANTDPSYLLPLDMQIAPAGAPAASATNLANTQGLGSSGCIGFDSRGVVNYSTCGSGTPVVWFMSIGLSSSTTGYRAVTVSPMGQAKSWTASSNSIWNTM
jgi:prepilin-type N-terminal cleavage/methylation domain-containing protein